MNAIMKAFRIFHNSTCIRFKERSFESSYISIESATSGCWSFIGRVGGKQTINLQSPGCFVRIGSILHELMHTLGFYHEHTRIDRDDFINIFKENAVPSSRNNFNKDSFYRATTQDIPYDLNSVLHYGQYAFSFNNKPTITMKQEVFASMGQRNGFSPSDVIRINKAYGCSRR